MAEIRANTATIKSTANSIRDDASAYGAAQEQLFQTVTNLRDTWTSEDGNAYIAKITSFQAEFETLKKNLEQSAAALEMAAIQYERTIIKNTIR